MKKNKSADIAGALFLFLAAGSVNLDREAVGYSEGDSKREAVERMLWKFALGFVAFVLGLSTWTCAQTGERTLVTREYKNTDLIWVLKDLAKAAGANCYVGPTVVGTVSRKLVNVPVEQAVRMALMGQENQYDFVFLKGPSTFTLVVAPADKLAELDGGCGRRHRAFPQGTVRMEYLLQRAPAITVLDSLKRVYTEVEFTLHPTTNGFYARGSREDLLTIKRELVLLDVPPAPPTPPLQEAFPVRRRDSEKILTLLRNLVPEVEFSYDPKRKVILAVGQPGQLDIARELLSELAK